MDYCGVKVLNTKSRGRGVFASAKIEAGSLIASFDGDIYYWDWPSLPLPDDAFEHAIPFADNYVRDSKGIARYVNHSCNPNCGIRDLFDIATIRAIEPGEELVWDYDTAQDDDAWTMDCECGEATCRKTIRGYRYLSQELRSQYRTITSEWLLAKMARVASKPAQAAMTIGTLRG